MAKSANRPNLAVVILILVVLAAIGAYVWVHKHGQPGESLPATETKAPPHIDVPHVAADKLDPANEGRLVTIEGPLSVK